MNTEQTTKNDNDVVEQVADALANRVMAVFDRNLKHRINSGINKELLECLCQATSKYTDEDLAKFKAIGMEPVYFPYTATKIQAAVAWTSEIFLNTGDKTYSLRPTPKPDIPKAAFAAVAEEYTQKFLDEHGVPATPEEGTKYIYYMMEREKELYNAVDSVARSRAEAMERLIDDQLFEGGWRQACSDFIYDICTYGTGVIKGPEYRNKRVVKHVEGANGTTCEIAYKVIPTWQHIPPFDCYPSPGAVEISDGDFCHIIRMTPEELGSMRGVKGYNEEAINDIIRSFPSGGLALNLTDDAGDRKAKLNDGSNRNETALLEGVSFFGRVLGEELIRYGVKSDLNGATLDPLTFYEVECIVMNQRAVFCELHDPRVGIPYAKGTFQRIAGSWWGDSPAHLMRDLQREMNAAKRNSVANMAFSSGPIKIVNDINAIQNPNDVKITRPWQTIIGKRSQYTMSNRPLVEFIQTPSVTHELIGIVENCIRWADLVTGIPAYSHGSNLSAGASRTSSGLAMLLDAAQRGIKQVIFSIDHDVMRPLITNLYHMNLLYEDDPSIKGDCHVDVGGLLAMISRDKNVSLIKEFLVLLQDPIKAQAAGPDAIRALMRELARMLLWINPDDIIPTKEMADAALAAQQQAMLAQQQAMIAQQQQGGGQQMPQANMTGGGIPVPTNGMEAADPMNSGQFQPNGVQAQMMEG